MHLLLGTNNKGKIIEMREVLGDLSYEIKTPDDFLITDVPEENGKTFYENAKQKAQFYSDRSRIPTVADDSGLIVEALQDELGIHTRRWGAGPEASDEEWITYFLDRMNRASNKRARFVCALHFIDDQGNDHQFEGMCEGTITDALQADYLPGLPISACFQPDGSDKVFSALSTDEKNRISHRGLALWQLRDFLNRKS